MNLEYFYRQLYHWWEQNKRELPWRDTEDGYRIWLSEIILQQTRVQQGMEYYMRFVNRWPDVEALAQADEQEVLREWQGLGYYSRARNLHKAARQMVEKGTPPGPLSRGERVIFPQTYDELRALPGVGDYTAGAIASFAYNLPYPAMDGNVYRVVARLTDCSEAFDTTAGKKLFHQKIEQLLDREHPRLFNSAIMEFGALYCTPSLTDSETGACVCERCVIKEVCEGYQHHTAELLPVRKPRPQLKDRYLNYTIYLSEQDGEVCTLIHQRTAKDIWQHLWEFVLEESENHVLALHKGTPYVDINHVLSHQRLHARFAICRTDRLPQIEGTRCVRLSELDAYGLSRLTLKALDQLRATAGF